MSISTFWSLVVVYVYSRCIQYSAASLFCMFWFWCSYTFRKVFNRNVGFFSWLQSHNLQAYHCIHTSRSVSNEYQAMEEPQQNPGAAVSVGDSAEPKPKRKKLKGKRAVTRFLKSLRWKKKKEIQRMTAEEKILYKLKLVSCVAITSIPICLIWWQWLLKKKIAKFALLMWVAWFPVILFVLCHLRICEPSILP